jgi:hypothetical protein
MNLRLTLNFDRSLEVKYWSPTLNQKKRLTEKRLIFTGQKISLLALHTASLELDSRLLVKSQKIDRKIVLFEKLKNKKNPTYLNDQKKILYKIA